MPVTVLAVDPDVWKASATDLRCRLAISEIWENPATRDKYAIALDGGDLEDEYATLMKGPTVESDVKKILQDLVNQRDRSSRVCVVKPYMPQPLEAFIAQEHCDTPVEPVLIAMAASQDAPKVTLLLVGNDTIRPRALHHPYITRSLRHLFREMIAKPFTVKCATDYALLRDDKAFHTLNSRVFEDQIRSIMQQRTGRRYGLMPSLERITPKNVYHYRCADGHCSGEVDVYLYLDLPDCRLVWIGECELREEGNEGVFTNLEKVMKLLRKVEGVRSFEQERCKTQVFVRGYLVTNAEGLAAAALRVANRESLEFVHAKMQIGWTGMAHWQLEDDDIANYTL